MTLKELDDDERQRMIDSDDFMSFFMRNAKILEKALDQDDIFFEYGATDNEWVVRDNIFRFLIKNNVFCF